MIPASDADFVQSTQEEESSLDQTTKGIDHEPSRFRAFLLGLEQVQRDLHNSRQPGITQQDLKSTKEPHEYNEFRTIRLNYPRIQRNCHYPLEEKMIPKSAESRSSLEMRIPCNSRWVLYSSEFFMICTLFISQIHLLYNWCKRIFLIRTNT